MNIVALIGSRRKRGNSAAIAVKILEEVHALLPQLKTERLFLGDYTIGACTGCEGCSSSWECVINDDYAAVVEKIDRADGVILVSPTYWYSVTSDMKRFIDRSYSLIRYPNSRRQWIGKYRNTGKLSITAAVCEQPDESMMGNTLTLLSDFCRDIGLEPVASVKALGHFEAGAVHGDMEVDRQIAHAAGLLAAGLRASHPPNR